MTASLYARALWHGCAHVLRLRALPLRRRLLLLALKLVAITAYWWPRLAQRWRGAPPRRGSEPAAAVAAASDSHLRPPPTAAADVVAFPAGTSIKLPTAGGAAQAAVVVVPAWIATPQQAARLQRLAAALARGQALPPAAVIVVDDCSPVPVAGLLAGMFRPGGHACAAWRASMRAFPLLMPSANPPTAVAPGAASAAPPPPALLVHRLPANRGPAAARNAGLLAAAQLGAAVVLFLDDDCQPAPGWVAAMLAAQAAAPGLVGGCTMATRPGTLVGLFHDTFGTLNGRRAPDGSLLYAPTCNLSASLASLRRAAAGGSAARSGNGVSQRAELLLFDESFRAAAFEDVEFCIRARKAGVPIR